VLAARGTRGGTLWLWLAGGLAIFCAADVVYALQVTSGTYVVGSVLNGLWALRITVLALALWRPQRPPAVESGRSAAILAVPMLATATAVVVLVIGAFGNFPAVVVALASFTLLLAAARTLVGFRQVQRLSDAHRQSVTDDLTGLGNRRGLFELGEERLRCAGRDERLALLLVDLDNFKELNDTLGHHAGDELLREVARRLEAGVAHPDLLVRLGGDEFALLLELTGGEDGCELAERILERLSKPLVIKGRRLRTGASAGVAVRDDADLGIAELLRRADLSMYAAKAGSGRVAPYDARLDDATRARLAMIQDLDNALRKREFVLHYQPKIDLRSGAALDAEALMRWQHPTRGLLYPDAFLPLVEQSGLMGALTKLVLETAVQQLAAWRRAGLPISIAVNLSASDLLDEALAERIATLLAEHDLPAFALELEITESVLMTDPERACRVLDELRQLGLQIAMDDYGTGYCALAYLRDLPIDELKIDRSFVADVTSDPRSAAIVRSTIELAHALGLTVVAEGVEDEEALDAVKGFGCDFAQGYHFSRPLPADAFAGWLLARASVDTAPRAPVLVP
jgi:diguanylate cyclase (GGDEF)-like protein